MPTLDEQVAAATIDRGRADWRTRIPKPRQADFAPGAAVTARIVTNKGTLRVRLLPDSAPMHVTSFAYLARLGFYDGLSFHRVIKGFMAQGGCPLGSGTGGPGYKFDGEYGGARHDARGVLSTANAGPGTDGSQFFITFVPTPWLDGKHTVFGVVDQGMEVLDALEAAGSQGGQPKEPLTIESVTIEGAA